MKRILMLAMSISCLFLFRLSNATMILAENRFETDDIESIGNSELCDFISEGYRNEYFYVLDADGNDITSFANQMIVNRGVEALCYYMQSENGTVGFAEISESSSNSPFALTESHNISSSEYKIASDTTGQYRKEWRTRLSCSYYQNVKTGIITSASSPTLILEYSNFGAFFTPYLQNVSTYYRINSAKTAVTFYGTYTMRSTLGVSIGDFPVGFDFNFGRHTHSLTGY